jgi:thiol-disulfide isomerase/thioredoxin
MIELSRRSIVFLVFLSVGTLVLFALLYYVYYSPTGLKARQNALLTQIESTDEASYIALDGSTTDITKYDSEVLIVNVWASWSPYTNADHAILETLKRTYGENVTIRAINRKETKETANAYLASIGTREGIEYVVDTTDHFFNSLLGYAMPETIVFDAIGNVVFHKRGTLDEAEMKGVIDSMLKEE